LPFWSINLKIDH